MFSLGTLGKKKVAELLSSSSEPEETKPHYRHAHNSYYPPVPSDPPSAHSYPNQPNHEGADKKHHRDHSLPDMTSQIPGASAGLKAKPTVYVANPTLEPQPWVLSSLKWLKNNTTGIARVDLFRPMPPSPDSYDGNILFTKRSKDRRGHGRHTPEQREQFQRDGYEHVPLPMAYENRGIQNLASKTAPLLTGARVKLTRSFQLGKDEAGLAKPLLDFGLGVNLDVTRQRLEPVVRLKLKDLVSIKAVPLGVVKLSHVLPLGAVALKVHYEVPIMHMNRFWEPPARLMVRLDTAPGSGIHLTPSGVEFDQRVLRFGNNVSLRGSAAVLFPRQLPIDREEDGVRLQVHRLSLKSIW